jgi:hypothetical protein
VWGLVLNLDDPLVTVFALQAFGFEKPSWEWRSLTRCCRRRCICAAAAAADDDDGAANDGHSFHLIGTLIYE